uniref:Replication protein n=1 Tax=Luscinia sibilans parvo-like hybrid virus TaxID=2794515 RepID=A0A8A4XEA6_9VIRU|nr:MAG: replication protein [Luscinia sibilans parvo-like hybrid virus]
MGDQQLKSVPYHHEDRQWDARFNVQRDEDFTRLVDAIKRDWDTGKLKYVLIGGRETGTRSYQGDYGITHVHVAAIFNNRVSKRSIIKNWDVQEGNGYYLVPRNRDLSYSGWRNHHIKPFSKNDGGELLVYEQGELPKDVKRKRVEEGEEEKKLKIDEILIVMKKMLEEDKEEEAFNRFPKNYLMYGEKLKSTLKQRRVTAFHEGNPHLWVTGYPGTGKTAILNFIYPKLFKKNLYNKYFDLYDPKEHTHVMLEDMDHEAVEKLSINFIKTICDEAGFSIDQKYKSPQLARTTVLVSSNFTIRDIVPESAGFQQNLMAIKRRFWEIKIYELLRLLGLKLVPKEVRNQLKKEGNNDMSKIFLDWDHMVDAPTGRELKSPMEYQQIIRDYFFAITE